MGFFKDLKTSLQMGVQNGFNVYPVINFIIAGCQVVVLSTAFCVWPRHQWYGDSLTIVNGTLMILSGVLILQIRKQMNIHFKQQFD